MLGMIVLLGLSPENLCVKLKPQSHDWGLLCGDWSSNMAQIREVYTYEWSDDV